MLGTFPIGALHHWIAPEARPDDRGLQIVGNDPAWGTSEAGKGMGVAQQQTLHFDQALGGRLANGPIQKVLAAMLILANHGAPLHQNQTKQWVDEAIGGVATNTPTPTNTPTSTPTDTPTPTATDTPTPTATASGGWKLLWYNNGAGPLNRIACASSTICNAVGNSLIMHTEDSGNTWSMETFAGLGQGVTCVGSTCYAVGRLGSIVKSVDAGRSWVSQSNPMSGNTDLYYVFCFTADQCYVSGNSKNILSTNDGGSTWVSQPTGLLDGNPHLFFITCASPSICYAGGFGTTGDFFLKSSDGGVGWSSSSFQSIPFELACTSESNCLAATSAGVERTVDGGSTWALEAIGGQNGISCPSSTVCYAVGAGQIYRSNDGGSTWTSDDSPVATLPSPPELTSVACPSTDTCYASGSDTLLGRNVPCPMQLAPCNLSWMMRAPMPTPRGGAGAALGRDGKIYVIGGFLYPNSLTDNQAYDPSTDTWITRAPMPTARNGMSAVAANDGRLYVIGGNDGGVALGANEAYDPITDTWIARAPMPTPLDAISVLGSDGKIYAIGGGTDAGVVNTVYAYDPVTDTWATRAPLPFALGSEGLAATSDGKIYVFGGASSTVGGLNTVEMYDIATDTWTTRAPMPTPRYSLGTVLANNGRIYAISGTDTLAGCCTHHTEVEEYNPATDTWAERTSLPLASDGATTLGSNGKIYVMGGNAGYELDTNFEGTITPQ